MNIWKKWFTVFTLLLGVLLAAGQPSAPITTISMNVKAGLQFDVVRFHVNPGTKVKIILTNTDDMSHNLLITKPGSRLKVVNAALQLGEKGPAMNYIPRLPEVLFSIPVVAPNDIGSVTFTAPSTAGVYPYVCTLPGHGFVMYGAIYVTKNPVLPDIKKDVHIPPSRRNEANSSQVANDDAHAGHASTKSKQLHPYTPKAPYLYRVFIAGASPAAIAVSLPGSVSYCWDAGTCRLRFAWQGGFLDNSDLWKGKGDAEAKVAGKIFFQDNDRFPLRIGSADSMTVAYKGYRLLNRYPEFRYTVNGVDVYELITPKADGSGLIRSFSIPKVTTNVSLETAPQDGVTYSVSKGLLKNNRLLLSPEEAKKFTITITRHKAQPL